MAEEEQTTEQVTETTGEPDSVHTESEKKSLPEIGDDKPDDMKSGTAMGSDDFEMFDFDALETVLNSQNVNEEPEEEEIQDLGSQKITPKLLKEIANELGLIHLCWPDTQQTAEYAKKYPTTYYENNSKEKLLLLYAENFRQQFHFIYPDRKPLLLAADNECGLQKMVCTTIRPTRLPYPELSNWEGCAHFVADHLVYMPLHNPTRFPLKVTSPTSVLECQQGNCFEYSTVLCSFLTGIGYDAYVVSGYATVQLCQADQTNIENPEIKKYNPDRPPPPPPPPRKYEMKLTKEFDSQYLKKMQERAASEAQMKERQEELDNITRDNLTEGNAELPPDELFGVRVHSWVLIRPGTLGIEEAFFIDPPTARSFSPDDANFLGLESLWNNTNYWVNLQDCSEGCRNLKFDLKDPVCWNWLLLAEPWYMRTQKVEEEESEDEEEEYEDDEDKEEEDKERTELAKYMVEKHLDMSASWVSRLEIPETVYRKRYPGSHKEVLYYKSKVDFYAPYSRKEGLLLRIVTFSDKKYEVKEMVYSIFKNRSDLLTNVIHNFKTELVTENYARGREEGLKEHQYYMNHTGVEDKRKLLFYHEARSDCLSELVMDPFFLTVHYKDRVDFLYYRHAIFSPRVEGEEIEDKRKVLSLIEKFQRNPVKHYDEDIAERTCIPPEDKILLKFQYGDIKLVASTREFIKPPPEKMGDKLTFDPAMTVSFNIDPAHHPLKSFELFELFKEQLAAEEKAFFELRALEDELLLFLQLRTTETEEPKLSVSIYDTERNEDAKVEMQQKEQEMKEQIDKEHEVDVDYLAPYIARLSLTHRKTLSHKDALVVRDLCLADHKNTFVNRANNMQEAFEKTCNTLRVKHYWYEQQRDNLTKEDEDEYFEQCNQLRFYLHTLEIRLKRHRDLVPQKYAALEAWLKNDPRLASLYR